MLTNKNVEICGTFSCESCVDRGFLEEDNNVDKS